MRKKNFLLLLSIFAITCFFNGCQPNDEYSDDPTYDLCGPIWVDTFTTSNGIDCEQNLTYFPNGTGQERLIYFYASGNQVYESNFRWRWNSNFFDSIFMDFDNGGQIYFDNITIRSNSLSGNYDGVWVTFGLR